MEIYAPEMLLGVDHGEHDGTEPEGAMADIPVKLAVLGEGCSQHLAVLGAADDVGQLLVRGEEAAQDQDLKAERAARAVTPKETREVSHGVVPLASLHHVLQVRHGEEGVRLVEHPAADERRS